jgi:chromate transporter
VPKPDQGLSEDAPDDRAAGPPALAGIPFRTALAFWFKLGWISFGGPAGQVALMHQELVERRRWISEPRFLHALNYCMLLPGPEAQQLATYIGWSLHGVRGGVAAGVLFVLPSLFILIALSWLYAVQGHHPVVMGVLDGLKPAVVAVVAAAALRIGRRVLRHGLLRLVAAAAFVALAVFNTPFPAVVAAAALFGWWAHARWPQAFAMVEAGPAPTEVPTDFRAARRASWRCLVVCLLLWGGSMGALLWSGGLDSTLTQMGWFFTQAALLTFGGAYAVLPFVVQAAVEQHGWVTAAQMLDGLALGETTPGPLIMVVAFVGFMGAWGQALLGPEERLAAGALAAVVATWFTFLPSFLFILAGASWVDRLQTHGNPRWNAPLVAITAAVVGVILNLALYFVVPVLWPTASGGALSVQALAVGLLAGWLLMRRGWGVLPVLGVAAAWGLIAAVTRALA